MRTDESKAEITVALHSQSNSLNLIKEPKFVSVTNIQN